MYNLDNGSTDSKIICDFKSVYTVKPILQNSSFQLDQILDISYVELSLTGVEDALSSLDSKTSFDSNRVANIVLK